MGIHRFHPHHLYSHRPRQRHDLRLSGTGSQRGRQEPPSNRAEATPRAIRRALDFAHFANGASWQSGLVFVNGASHPIRPAVYFYDKEGNPIDPESVVDLTGDLEVQEDGALSVRSAMAPLGEAHDFNPRPRGIGDRIGDGELPRVPRRGSPALCPPRHRSRRGGSRVNP